MESFLIWLVAVGTEILSGISAGTVSVIDFVFASLQEKSLQTVDINLVLFSDTPIYMGNLMELLSIFFSIFYTVIFVVIWYKIIKKVFVKITRWNKW